MGNKLEFKDFVQNKRKYYIADLELLEDARNIAHTHDFYEFYVVLKGQFKEYFNEEQLIVDKNTVHVIRPQDTHYLTSTNQYDRNIIRNIAIEKKYFEQCLNEVGIEDCESIFDCFKLDEIAYQNYQTKTNLLLQLNNTEQTNHFLFQNILHDIFICGLIQRRNEDERIPKWLQFAYNEFSKDAHYIDGLNKLIELSGKSQEHFTREFKKHYGITPSEHINNLRLQHAAILLKTSNEKIIDIVYECGFRNLSYFNRLFKEKYLISPREYRDLNKKCF